MHAPLNDFESVACNFAKRRFYFYIRKFQHAMPVIKFAGNLLKRYVPAPLVKLP